MRTLIVQFGEGAGSCDEYGISGGSGYTVVDEYGRTTGPLCWDEMLGQVARLTLPAASVGHGYQMETPEAWQQVRREREQRMEARRAAAAADDEIVF